MHRALAHQQAHSCSLQVRDDSSDGEIGGIQAFRTRKESHLFLLSRSLIGTRFDLPPSLSLTSLPLLPPQSTRSPHVSQATSFPRSTRVVAARSAVPRAGLGSSSSSSTSPLTSSSPLSSPLVVPNNAGRAAFAALAAAMLLLGSPAGPALAVSGGGGEDLGPVSLSELS